MGDRDYFKLSPSPPFVWILSYLSTSPSLSSRFAFSCFSNDPTRPAVLQTIDSRSLVAGPSCLIYIYKNSRTSPPLIARGASSSPRMRSVAHSGDGEPLLALASLAPDYRLLSHPRVLLYLFPPPLLLSSSSFVSSALLLASSSRESARALYLDSAPAFFAAVVRRRSWMIAFFAHSAITISIPDRYYDVTISRHDITTFPGTNVTRQGERERKEEGEREEGEVFAIIYALCGFFYQTTTLICFTTLEFYHTRLVPVRYFFPLYTILRPKVYFKKLKRRSNVCSKKLKEFIYKYLYIYKYVR